MANASVSGGGGGGRLDGEMNPAASIEDAPNDGEGDGGGVLLGGGGGGGGGGGEDLSSNGTAASFCAIM